MKSRYPLNAPILVIGFFNNGKKKFLYPNFNAIVLSKMLHEDNSYEDIGFKILSIVPTEEHEVPVEYTEKGTVAGYIGVSNEHISEELEDYTVRFFNQYPKASYGQTDTSDDYHWKINCPEITSGFLGILKRSDIPYRFMNVSSFLDDLKYIPLEGKPGLLEFKERVLKTLKEDFNAWVIREEEILEGSGVYSTIVELDPAINFDDNDGCSRGPVTVLPGQHDSIKGKMICFQHPNKLAVHKVVGECDSFGCEYLYMCQECHDQMKEEEKNADTSGVCDWCKKHAPALRPHRDFEEGSCGRVYDVCDECIGKENKRISDMVGDYDEIDFCDFYDDLDDDDDDIEEEDDDDNFMITI